MGWVAINFDTKEASDQIVEKYQHNGPAWYGEDKRGRFNNNCTDFKYCALLTHQIPEWQESYDSIGDDYLLDYIDHKGKKSVLNLEVEGDDGINEFVFTLLKEIMIKNKNEITKNSKNNAIVSRIGIQMCDSEFEYFEII